MKNAWLRKIFLFILSIKEQNSLTETLQQTIVNELNEIINSVTYNYKDILQNHLNNSNLIFLLPNTTVFKDSFAEIETIYKYKQYMISNFTFIKPEEFELPISKNIQMLNFITLV